MRRNVFNQCISEHRFRDLFIELEWNNSRGDIYIDIDETEYTFQKVAEMRGYQVLACEVGNIPPTALCKRIDTKLRPSAQDYILIYHINGSEHQKWVIPVRNTDKRDLVTVEYQSAEQADFIYNKLEGLNMDGISNIADVKSSIQQVFAVNSEKITKDFFREFKTEHKAFLSMITGLDDHIDDKKNRNKDWYTSVMLNRLMFCYFIQKKGFLDGNVNYLHDKLLWMQGLGRNQFFGSFYKGFLCSLFHDGLNSPRHKEDFREKYGRIPYLNGGMFDEHQLEQEYKDIDIKDEAFERLFTFFDKWEWHLDTRLTASGKDINPDVLGYIFEQYINDRAAMGAYYTKEDITEYIGKNCILPFIMDKVKAVNGKDFTKDGYVWKTLRNSGDCYIYDAVKKGYSKDWQQCIPNYIYKGIDTTQPELLERRSRWNEKTAAEFALPTEIWRETVERLQRCDSLLQKINEGEIIEINDFITYNLDIRQFVYDLLLNTEDHTFVEHFYSALQSVTILDPTCGSGAFLFAAMNILEPLYEVCIDRMEDWHRQNPNLFKSQLEEINKKYRSNRQYFIYKSIILRNLYGVDIMVEATEIAKLRLFLKMVAVVEVDMRADNLGLDPLPDIDFNIRCGNTLVGYATQEELERDLSFSKDIFEEIANQEFRSKIELEMDKAAHTFKQFKTVQFRQEEDMSAFKEAKRQLRTRLSILNDALNRRLYKSLTLFDAKENKSEDKKYCEWEASHQPFHWLAEFYEIIHGNGGFDVIIGNPPYVEHSSKDIHYSLSHLKSADCGNLYGNCIDRGISIGNPKGFFSFIIPVAITCSKRMDNVISMLKGNSRLLLFSNFDDRPGKLFEVIEHLRASIFISSRGLNDNKRIYATKYNRWYTEHRRLLFKDISYIEVGEFVNSFVIPKFSSTIECNINRKLKECKSTIASSYSLSGDNKVYYRAAGGGYFLLIKNCKSITYIDGKLEDVKAEKAITINPNISNDAIGALLSSTLFYWNYIAYTDCRNLTKAFIDNFGIATSAFTDSILIKSGKILFNDYEANKNTKNTTYRTTGRNVIYDEYYPKLSKKHIDEIDKVLAKHYGFTEEELDFIINYDIKYRMGDNLNEEE